MKASQIKSSLVSAIAARRPAFIWGSPGIGKSQVVAQVAKEKNMDLRDVRAVLLDPVDLRGLPVIKEGRANWVIPDFLPDDGQGILFLDELNAAPVLVQAACYQLILDRKLGDYTLPKDWIVFGAGNKETDRAITSRMSTATSSRFTHLYFDVDLNDWVDWALDSQIESEVVAFIRFRPGLLHSFDPAKNEKSFPCPRTWEFVSDFLKVKPDKDVEFELICGIVGEGAATEFFAFLKMFRDLPDLDGILVDPKGASVPKDPGALYAVAGGLARKSSDSNFGRIIEYANRLPVEFSVLLVRDSIKLNADVAKTKAFIDWSARNSEVLI